MKMLLVIAFCFTFGFTTANAFLCGGNEGSCECVEELGLIICQKEVGINRLDFTAQFLSKYTKLFIKTDSSCQDIEIYEYTFQIDVISNKCAGAIDELSIFKQQMKEKSDKLSSKSRSEPVSDTAYGDRFYPALQNFLENDRNEYDWTFIFDIGLKAMLFIGVVATALFSSKINHNIKPFVRILPGSYRSIFSFLSHSCKKKVFIYLFIYLMC